MGAQRRTRLANGRPSVRPRAGMGAQWTLPSGRPEAARSTSSRLARQSLAAAENWRPIFWLTCGRPLGGEQFHSGAGRDWPVGELGAKEQRRNLINLRLCKGWPSLRAPGALASSPTLAELAKERQACRELAQACQTLAQLSSSRRRALSGQSVSALSWRSGR